MLFKDLKQGYPVYGLYKNDLRAVSGKVVNVGEPYFDSNMPNTQNQGFNRSLSPLSSPTLNRVVDVTIEFEGKTNTYTISESSSFVYADNLVMATDKNHILKEVEVIKGQREEIISKIPKYKEEVEKCKSILAAWSPSFKEKEETEKRFNKIEGDVNEIKSDLKLLLEKLG